MADLLVELFTLESDFIADRNRQLRGLQCILENPALGQLFVLRIDGRVAGMANLLRTVSTALGAPVAWLEDVIIAAPHRGRGHGRQLIEHVIDWARAQGLARLTLLVDHDNTAALSFYARLGFTASAMVVRRRLI